MKSSYVIDETTKRFFAVFFGEIICLSISTFARDANYRSKSYINFLTNYLSVSE